MTFVGSLSLAIGLQLTPERHHTATGHAGHKPTPEIVEAVAPVVPMPAQPEPSAPHQAPAPGAGQEPIRLTAGEQITDAAPVEQPGGEAPQSEPADGSPMLTRVLTHIPGSYGEEEALAHLSSPPPWSGSLEGLAWTHVEPKRRVLVAHQPGIGVHPQAPTVDPDQQVV